MFEDFELVESYKNLLSAPLLPAGAADRLPSEQFLDALADLHPQNKIKCKVWPLEACL